MRFITQSREVANCSREADLQKQLNKGNFSLKYSCIPSLLLETSIWEHASVRASAVEAGGFGASAATLELVVTV